MYILNKKEDELYVIYPPEENIRIGTTLRIEDKLCQVVDIEYANVPGIVKHVLRKSIVGKSRTEEEIQEQVSGFLNTITDQKLAITKIRGTIKGGEFSRGFQTFDVRRSSTAIDILSQERLMEMLKISPRYRAKFAKTLTEDPIDYDVPLDELGINLITGMKGSGKSYAAKKILLRLIREGKVTVVFDINGEYVNLWKDEEGEAHQDYYKRIKILDASLTQGRGRSSPLRIPLSDVSWDEFAEMVNIGNDTQMYNELISFWSNADRPFDLNDLREWARDDVDNDFTRQGLLRKIRTAESLHLFGNFDLESEINNLEEEGGGAIIINMRFLNKRKREMIVNFILNHVSRLRKNEEIKPLSLFAEEAQLYVNQQTWDDLLTRMRHYGIYPTIITNDPTTLPGEVFSLCDNLISFMFHNQDDLAAVSKAKVIDETTLKMLEHIQKRQAILIGDITNDYPMLVEVKPEEGVMMGGETQELF